MIALKNLDRFLKNARIVLVLVTMLHSVTVSAAGRRSSYDEENNTLLREMSDSIADLKHQVRNHESEIRTFEEKLNSQELIMESVREQLAAASQSHKDFLKDSSNTLDGKMSNLEGTTKGLVTDLKQLKTHANDSTAALGQYKQKLGELERLIDNQNQHMTALETALRSMMEALQAGDPGLDKLDKNVAAVQANGVTSSSSSNAASSGTKTYKVQPGDTLEKIATRHGTTIKVLKDLNGLANDRIIVGKNLRVP